MAAGGIGPPSGSSRDRRARISGVKSAIIRVSTMPGATALTLIPRQRSSTASARVRPTTAAFEAT